MVAASGREGWGEGEGIRQRKEDHYLIWGRRGGNEGSSVGSETIARGGGGGKFLEGGV